MLAPKTLLFSAQSASDAMLADIRALVEIESPSDDASAVNRAVNWVEERARALGARVQHHPQSEFGDHLELRFGSPSQRPAVLLLGHLDTVWSLGTLASMPFEVAAGRAWGPGVLDMKTGIIMALQAIRTLAVQSALDREVILWLVSDEEVGSATSRPLTESLARQAGTVLVLEPAQGVEGAVKTWRKGVGNYTLRVHGVAAHAGVDPEKGHSAITELSHQILKIREFNGFAEGLSVNPGTISGGTRSNVIAAHAMCEIDVRVKQASDAQRIDDLLRSLTPVDPRCKLEIEGGMNRPPMERTKATVALFERARVLAEQIGFELEEKGTGGGSDGNFTAALGIPTLDGLGGVGEGAHATHESIVLEELPRRTALLAGLLQSV